MSEPFDLGPVPERIDVSVEQVRRLVAEQFPQWARLRVRPVANGGWDNRTFHLGPDLTVRLPSAAPYALAVEKEHRWLPEFAPALPVPIPAPVGRGKPGVGYPFEWSVYSWLDGTPVDADPSAIGDLVRFAQDVAGFIVALRNIDATEGPTPGVHNWFRGGPLRTYDAETQEALAALGGRIDVELAAEIWQVALAARWDGTDTWFHGDIAVGNLLLADGELAAVIDFGTCGIGDPACDLAIAWTLLRDESRAAFRDRLSVDAETWARGRGWALWKALITYKRNVDDDDELTASSKRVVDEIFAEYSTAR